MAKDVIPSPRGELEITTLNNAYLEKGQLEVQLLGRGFAWLDSGTPESLIEASHFIQTIEEQQGLKVACLEEIGIMQKWISKEQVLRNLNQNSKSSYVKKLISICREKSDVIHKD